MAIANSNSPLCNPTIIYGLYDNFKIIYCMATASIARCSTEMV